MRTIDVYSEPMTLKEIQKQFNKSEAAVGMAVKRMLDRNPDHQDWKIKEGRNTLIAPEGIEWLKNYFIGANLAVVDEEKTALQAEVEGLKAALNQFDGIFTKLEDQYKDKLELALKLQRAEIAQNEQVLITQTNSLKKENERLEQAQEELKTQHKIELDALSEETQKEIDQLKEEIKKRDEEIKKRDNASWWVRLRKKW